MIEPTRPMSGIFFFNDAATTEIYTLSLHDALPICPDRLSPLDPGLALVDRAQVAPPDPRSEEHTSELQSQSNLVCRLLLEKKNSTYAASGEAAAAQAMQVSMASRIKRMKARLPVRNVELPGENIVRLT